MIKDVLTIVIPCKNEEKLIGSTLGYLNNQSDIFGTKVIICDSSNDMTRDVILTGGYDNLDIEIIDGGYPAVARNKGASLCKTPYILFMDADIFLMDVNVIKNSIFYIIEKYCHLITCKFKCDGKYSYVFPIFEFFRDLLSNYSPFAIGGFMLFKKDIFDSVGGFVNEDKFAEDFHISIKISPDYFGVTNDVIYTTDRRFKQKGIVYMIKMAMLSMINKNNPNFFKNDHNYWI
jgi:glycosyltransferase involved in cell wall biosynthesis